MNQIALRLAKVLSRSKNRFVYSVSQKLVTMPFSKQLFSTAGGSKYTFDEEKAKSVSVSLHYLLNFESHKLINNSFLKLFNMYSKFKACN